jgi:hypothetical protein
MVFCCFLQSYCLCKAALHTILHTFNEEEARAAELATPAAAALPTEIVRSKVGGLYRDAGLLRCAVCSWCTSMHGWLWTQAAQQAEQRVRCGGYIVQFRHRSSICVC